MSKVIETDRGIVRLIQLNHESHQNPFNKSLEDAIKTALRRADDDALIKAVVVHGGENRSFSAGGDFAEVKDLLDKTDIDAWIDRVNDLYLTVLRVNKPTVAAIQGVAIGMGFQFGMMFDWRIMAENSELAMPELKHGIGCSIGATILRETTSFNVMRDIIFRCDRITACQARQYNLINDVVDEDKVLDHAIASALLLAEYPQTAFQNTKRAVNRRLADLLINTAKETKEVHRAAFMARDAQRHFKNILKKKYV